MNYNHLPLLASLGSGLVNHSALFLLYLGPETVMPVASILAAALGFLLIFWRMILKGVKRILNAIFKRNSALEETATVEQPVDISEKN